MRHIRRWYETGSSQGSSVSGTVNETSFSGNPEGLSFINTSSASISTSTSYSMVAENGTNSVVIQSPSALSPFNNPARCHDRRNIVIRAMSDAGFIPDDAARRAAAEPLTVVQRALEAEHALMYHI